MAIPLLLGAIFLAGFVDAIAGGGGLISLPAYAAAGLPPHAALATNKFSSSCGTAVALARYWRAGTVRLRSGLFAVAGALVGSAIGARIVLLVPGPAVNAAMLVLLPAILVVFLAHVRLRTWLARVLGVRPASDRPVASVLIGLGVGGYDGAFGPGTGTILTIAFAVVLGFGLLTAAANARLVNLASNLGSLAVFLAHGRVAFPLAFATATAGIAGNALGAHLAVGRGERVIRPLLALVLGGLLAMVARRWWLG